MGCSNVPLSQGEGWRVRLSPQVGNTAVPICDTKHHENHVYALTETNRGHRCHSSKQDQDRQKQLARQRLVTWQQKDQSEMNKVKEELKNLETGTKPVPVSIPNIGALQVCAATNVQGFELEPLIGWEKTTLFQGTLI